MDIQLPEDLEASIRARVASGHFASIDAAMTEAARLLLRERGSEHAEDASAHGEENVDPVLGSMREYAESIDEIVADAYLRRRTESWRSLDL